MDTTLRILSLAAFLGTNDPEGNTFTSNVSYYVDYARNLLNAGMSFDAPLSATETIRTAYPELARLSLEELLAYS